MALTPDWVRPNFGLAERKTVAHCTARLEPQKHLDLGHVQEILKLKDGVQDDDGAFKSPGFHRWESRYNKPENSRVNAQKRLSDTNSIKNHF